MISLKHCLLFVLVEQSAVVPFEARSYSLGARAHSSSAGEATGGSLPVGVRQMNKTFFEPY